MHIILRAEIIVLGHQVSEIERELNALRLDEIFDGEDYSDGRRVILGQHSAALRLFDLASEHFTMVMGYNEC
jgi:hypothetical protein